MITGKPFYHTTAVGQENLQNVSLYYPTALCRVQIMPKMSTNITHGICTSEDQLDRFSHNVQATNWIEITKKMADNLNHFFDNEESEWLANIDPSLFNKSNKEKHLEDSDFLCKFHSASHTFVTHSP